MSYPRFLFLCPFMFQLGRDSALLTDPVHHRIRGAVEESKESRPKPV